MSPSKEKLVNVRGQNYYVRYHHISPHKKNVSNAHDLITSNWQEAVIDGQVTTLTDDVVGCTRCDLEALGEVGKIISSGFSFCCTKDNFSRKTGRDIALGRAIKSLEKKLG